MLAALLFNSPLALAGLLALRALALNPARLGLLVLRLGLLTPTLALGAVMLSGGSVFGVIQLAAWALFLHLPLLALGAAVVLRGQRLVAAGLTIAGLGVAGVGVDAFLIEPQALEVNHLELTLPEAPTLRIALIADIQTDRVGDYERRALQAAADARPDLVLFTGDYVQLSEKKAPPECDKLAAQIRETGLSAPLGMYAVEGDVDPPGWERCFEGTAVQVLTQSTALPLPDLALHALDPADSRNHHLQLPPTQDFRVVFGHAPDFALGLDEVALLLAGHTHGGQVQLPFIGPLLTLSSVPRDWASGHTHLPSGGQLVVSRGIGMERLDAPRLRFLCRPEVVIIDLAGA